MFMTVTGVQHQIQCEGSSRKVPPPLPLFTDRDQILCILYHGRRALEHDFQEEPSKGSPDTAENVLCSPRKVPFSIEPSQPNAEILQDMGASIYTWISRKTLRME